MSLADLPERLNAADVFVDVHIREGRGDKPAILCGDRTVTYGDLYEGVNRVGNVAAGPGTRMEERVAILLPDTPEWVFAFFGAMKIGAVAVPMNTMLKPKDYEYLLNDSRARVLVVASVAAGPRVARIRDELEVPRAHPRRGRERCSDLPPAGRSDAKPPRPSWSRPTRARTTRPSGSTARARPGFPKGAIHLHHDMIVEADLYAKQTIGLRESDVSFLRGQAVLRLRAGQRALLPAPRRRDHGAAARPAHAGQGVRGDRPLPADRLLQRADQLRGAVAPGRKDRAGPSLGRVRMCVSAGETAAEAPFREMAGAVRRGDPRRHRLDGDPAHLHLQPARAGEAGSTGQIVPGYEAKIVDEDGNELPPRQVGTLLIKGDSIAAGYWNKHEQTKQTFCGEWINTHDKFLIDEDGYFWYAGRTDDMMKVSGQAVWPTDVEGLLQQHPAVLESGVVGHGRPGRADQAGGLRRAQGRPRGIARTGPRAAGLRQEKTTSPHKYPRAVVFVDDLPKTATGKIKRYVPRERAAAETPLHR